MQRFKGPKPVIGILGGIGSGKSHVARAFSQLGCGVIDADQLARQALNSPDAVKQITQWWGTQVLGLDGLPNRKAIAEKVFSRPDELSRLESLIHPIVQAGRNELVRQMNADPSVPAIVDDCPLLLEKKLDGPVDVLVFVDATLETRAARVKASRGWSVEELKRRELLQMGLDTKQKRADYVIQNNEGSDCVKQAQQVLQRVLRSQQ